MITQTQRLRLVTGIEHINPHTFRHLGVTELLERGASEQTVVAIAGWSSPRMFATYSHARLGAELDAVALLGPASKVQRAPANQEIVKSPGYPAEAHVEINLMNAVVQAEIARQVDLALQRERGEGYVQTLRTEPAKGPRLHPFRA